MIDIKTLPKDPIEAIQVALGYAMQITDSGKSKFIDLKKANHPVANNLIIACTIVRRAANRIPDPDIRDLVIMNASFDNEIALSVIHRQLQTALNAIIVSQLDDHFLDSDDIEMFDRAELTNEEKQSIRELMADARQLVDRSDTLHQWQKRNVLFHISKIENELHKEKSVFQTFVAAGYEVSALAKRVGEDAQPIANAIQKARTITSRKVKGQAQIEQDEKPKQLSGPKNDKTG